MVLGRGQDSSEAVTAAGGRPPHQPQLTSLDGFTPRTSLVSAL